MMTGIEMIHVPYRGDMFPDLMHAVRHWMSAEPQSIS
jgi:hypothetical protein